MIAFVTDLVDKLVMSLLFGDEILALFNQYFETQTDPHKVLIIIGVGLLSVLGIIQLVKWVFKVTKGFIKVALIVGIAYYVFVVVLGFDIWSYLPF